MKHQMKWKRRKKQKYYPPFPVVPMGMIKYKLKKRELNFLIGAGTGLLTYNRKEKIFFCPKFL